MKPLVIIPARKGSQGVPRKNVRRVYGQSLLERAIGIGQQVGHVVVTTDDDEAKRQADTLGVEVLDRPKALATAHCPMREVVNHALRGETGRWVLLQPTTPTRTVTLVRQMLRVPIGIDLVVATVDPGESAHALRFRCNGSLMPVDPQHAELRQDATLVYRLNGAAYIGKGRWGLQTLQEWVTTRQINVDTPEDWRAWVAFRKHEVGR